MVVGSAGELVSAFRTNQSSLLVVVDGAGKAGHAAEILDEFSAILGRSLPPLSAQNSPVRGRLPSTFGAGLVQHGAALPGAAAALSQPPKRAPATEADIRDIVAATVQVRLPRCHPPYR